MRFSCPKCGKSLEVDSRGCAVCQNGHSYDKSKYGYYNLLLATSGGTHGDNREMVIARREFLGAGYYRPLADSVASLVLEFTPPKAPVLDTGCGEGYYTDLIESALYRRDGVSFVSAFDISKDAVRYAKRRNPSISCAVCGSYHMPITDGTFATVINMFSPNAHEEVARVLASGGIYIMTIPAENHLFALKAAIYENPYKNKVADTALEGFELIKTEHIHYNMHLGDNAAVCALFGMTPYAYRTKLADRERIRALDSLDVEADFLVFVYKKLA